MNPSATVLTSQEITLEELKDVLLKAGGIYNPDPGGGNFGVIMQGEGYISLLVDQDEWHKSTTRFLNLLKHDQPDVLEEIRAKLGGEPQTDFEIDIGRTSSSQQLAVDFAILLTEIWPCVFIDLSPPRGVVFSRDDLFQLRKEGKYLAY
jgi:hypothetical protein